MPEHARRLPPALYDQQNEDRVADWGGDDLFTRMPRPRVVDDAPAPRFRPSLVLVEPPDERRGAPPAADAAQRERTERRRILTAEEAMHERAERLGLTVVESRAPDDEAGRAAPPDFPWEPAAPAESPRQPAAAPSADSPWDPAAWSAATHATVRRWDGVRGSEDRAPDGRRTKVITGRPDGAPRPLSLAPAERRRPARTPAEWVGPRPERIMAWAFVLGLLLILIAISTADAATL